MNSAAGRRRASFWAGRTLGAAVLALATVGPKSTLAASSPVVLMPLYEEPAPAQSSVPAPASRRAPAPAPAPPPCNVTVTELKDTRRAPETVGMFLDYLAVDAPPNREAWLRSIVDVGLGARGFKPTYALARTDVGGASPAAAPAPGSVSVRISLHTIWIATPAVNESASVVLSLAIDKDGPGAPQYYRGDLTRVNWGAHQKEFSDLADRTIARALDAMAADLRKACPAA